MIDFILASTLINSFTCFILIIFLYVSGNKYHYFTLFNLSLLLWNVFYGLSIKTDIEADSLLYNHICSFFGAFLGYLALNFTLELCKEKIPKRIKIINTYLVIFFAVLMLTPLMIKGVRPFMDFNFIPIMGSSYYVFILYYSLNTIAAHVILYKNLKYNPKTKFVFFGFIIGFTGGTTTILPYFGIPIYPVAMIAMSVYCPLITYAVIKHRLFDATIIINGIIARLITIISLCSLYIILILSYQFLISIQDGKEIILIVITSLFLIFSLEFYQIFVKELSKMMKKSYEYEPLSKKIVEKLSNVVDIDGLLTIIAYVSEKLRIEIKAVYVDQTWLLNKDSKDLTKIMGGEVDEDLLKVIIKQSPNLNLPIAYKEANIHLKKIFDATETSCIIPLSFGKSFLGFILVKQRAKNHFFSYDDLMTFDNLTFQMSSTLDRIRLHFKSLEQEKGLHEEKLKFTKSLAGSIAHELRNPLSTISLLGSQIKDVLSDGLNSSSQKKLEILTSQISTSISGANNIINIILSDMREKEVNSKDFALLKVNDIIPEIIENYGYKNKEELTRVSLSDNKLESDFIFKAVPERFTFIIYNLIKNALYYLKEYPDSKITIGAEKKVIDDKSWNTIYVQDTGPGIPQEAISKLFEDFFTSGKSDGTGLGLAFCKRNMKVFGGDIICESELGKWTKFYLLFPILSEEELKKAELHNPSNNNNKIHTTTNKSQKILIVDDQQTNLITTKRRIEKSLQNTTCDTALGGKEAVTLAKKNKYDLILMDIQMPKIGGVKTAKEIRNFDKEIPIIALTSLDHETFLKETQVIIGEEFNGYLNKSVPGNILYRTITKWMMDSQDQLLYMGEKDDYLKILQGKKIILADDQDINLMMTSKKLQSAGLEVLTATDGKDLVELYKTTLDKNGKSNIDLIATDINMPPYNGDKAAQEIRGIEINNKIRYRNQMPIIALSGDGEKEDIHRFFKCEMNDYFIKGGDPELMIKIIANYLANKGENKTNLYVNNDNDQIPEAPKANKRSNFSKSKILDLEKLENFDKSDQHQILNLFLTDSAKILRKIKHNSRDNDLEKMALEIHALKGIVGNIGADQLFESLRKIDLQLKESKLPTGNEWLNDINALYKELSPEINNILEK